MFELHLQVIFFFNTGLMFVFFLSFSFRKKVLWSNSTKYHLNNNDAVISPQLDPSIYESLQKERVEVGDVIYIEANSGAVKVKYYVFTVKKPAAEFEMEEKLH